MQTVNHGEGDTIIASNTKVLSLLQLEVTVCEQENWTRDQTHSPLNNSQMSYPETAVC
jgi:hypothetical protein